MPIPNIVWILPRPRRNRYQGGFPLHFEKKLVELLKPSVPILHPFGGMAEHGLRVDIKPEVEPDIIADAHHLPFKDNAFGMVVCDPPYNSDYSSKLYNTKPVKYSHYIPEAVRVCKPGGFVVSYHWALTPRPAGTAYRCRIFIAGRVWHRPRVACVFQKEQDGEYIDCAQCTRYENLDDALASCPQIVYFGRAHDHAGEVRQLRYHYACVKTDPEVQSVLSRARTAKLICPLPWVSGLEYLTEEIQP